MVDRAGSRRVCTTAVTDMVEVTIWVVDAGGLKRRHRWGGRGRREKTTIGSDRAAGKCNKVEMGQLENELEWS